MKKLTFLLALAPLFLASACAGGPLGHTSYPSGDRPDAARAYSDFMIARFAALTNDPEVAARHYASAISSAPDAAGAAERAVFSALLACDYDLAAGIARRAGEAGSDAALVRLTLAADLIRRGKTDAATGLLEASDLQAFNRMIALNLQAWSQLDSEGAAAAEVLMQQNRTGSARLDNATAHLAGLLQMAAGDDEAALATFDRLWASGARFAVAAEAYAGLLAARGERDRALGVLDTFRKEVGHNAALVALAARIQLGDTVEPVRLTAQQGVALSFHLPASILMQETDDDLASVYFVLALALDPELQPARTLLAQALVRGHRPAEAIRVLSEVPSSSPFYAGARGQLANTLLREDRAAEALDVAAEALAARPDRSLKLQLADLYRSLERQAEAEAILSDVIAADEAEARADWRVYFLRGAARERQAKWEGAEADLEKALDLKPDNAIVLNYLGYSWIDRGIKLGEGFKLIRRAVELEPDSGPIVDSLGWAHYRLGQYEEAVDYLERAVTLLPGDTVLNDHLGDAYWKTGRRKEAGFQWRRALTLDPEPDDRARIEQKLLGNFEGDPPSPGAAAVQ